MKCAFACAAAALLSVSPIAPPARAAPSAARQCAPPSSAREVGDTIRAFFAALAADDDAAIQHLTTPDFYAYDVGKRYSAPALSKVIADAHKSGRVIQWNIGQVDARVDCRLAFAAWENTGASGQAGQVQARAWLESALLIRRQGRWIISFLHSTPKDPRK